MSIRHPSVVPVTFLLLLLSARFSPGQDDVLLLDPRIHHLGDDATPEWPEASEAPEGGALEFTFEARANAAEWTLMFTQRHVDDRWAVRINGREIAVLRRAEAAIEGVVRVPAGTLVDGDNSFVLDTDRPTDDILFGNIRLSPHPLRETLALQAVRVLVTDGGQPSPARITIVDREGQLVPLYFAENLHQATRDGVVYTDRGVANFEIPTGEYSVWAVRGSEWSLAQAELTVGTGAVELGLSIEREVDTTGFVACDTHVHTLTFSGHGDSSVEERMVTLAGEGVELAVATDHNHNTDYTPYQERMGLNPFFTPIVGNEVTTPIGHFNSFPLDPADEVPAHEVHDVVQLVDGIRARGAQVVILNHPRWPDHARGPFGAIALDPFTGANNLRWSYPFDAVELINSATVEETPMLLFEDWFALLNRGERVSAVGSSDSHTVGVPVGGGRTYVPSATDNPGEIDVDAACRAMLEGRSSIAMGIFVNASAQLGDGSERFGMGDLVPVAGDGTCEVRLKLAAPSWIQPERATLYINGRAVKEFPLTARRPADGPTELECTLSLSETTGQDAWAVWVVTGAGIDGPYWPLHNDYTLGATNPIFLDWSGDGVYQSPAATARALVDAAGSDPRDLARALDGSSEAVALHVLELTRLRFEREARERLRDLAARAAATHGRIGEYLDGLAGPR